MASQRHDRIQSAASVPPAQLVGNAFANQYYHILVSSPDLVHWFYQETSKLGRPQANGAMVSVTTTKAINDKITSMDVMKAEIETVDVQGSLYGGLIMLVTGHLTGRRDGVRREFTQTFFLAPQEKGFFVLNDLFRFTGASSVLPVVEHHGPSVHSHVHTANEGLSSGTALHYQTDREKNNMEALKDCFKKADLNNNGKITRSEAVSFLRGFCMSDHVLAQSLGYVDKNKTGFLSRQELFNVLRLVSVAQSIRAFTPNIAKYVLHDSDAAQISPPKMESARLTFALPGTSQPRVSSPRYPESDLTETSSGESDMRFVQALSLMLQDGYNLEKIAKEESKRSNEVKKKILGACEKVVFSMNDVQTEFYRREKQHKKEIEGIHMREDDKAYLLKIEIEVLKLELYKQKQELDKRISDSEGYNSRLEQRRDDTMKDDEGLGNQKECCSTDLGMSLSSQFSSSELEQATENFSESLKIGEGGFGCVYKGTLRRTTVAIKKLNSVSLQGVSQFQQEVAILTKVRHPNLVNLIGSCSEISALVYEFLPNGSLEDRLVCANNTPSLTWQARTRIISEICLALVFLHSSKPHLVIHGDLKPENILLDANFTSKLSDFGISRIIKQSDTDMTAFYRTAHPAGTFAYTDPQFLSTGELTPKSDVYSFGIIVLRLLTGKPPLNIASTVQEAMQSGRLQTIIDESAGKWPFELAKKLAKLGLRCVDMSRKKRPDMIQVWAMIEPLVKVASQSLALSSDGSDFNEEHVPSHFICPILQEIMKDPCIAADGFTYETKAIKRWLSTGHNTSPMTNLVLPHRNLIPNHVLRSAIQEWLDNSTCR